MATRNGGPAYQNKYGFRHNKNSKKTAKILALPNCGVCRRCHEIIEWRKKFRKYKPIKDPAKCADCGGRTVLFAYHTICNDCAVKRGGVCPKCCKSESLVEESEPAAEGGESTGASVSDSFLAELSEMPLKERQRRTLQRLLDRDGITESEIRESIKKFQFEEKAAEIRKGKDPINYKNENEENSNEKKNDENNHQSEDDEEFDEEFDEEEEDEEN